jgi:hypothetical protein
MIYQLICRRTGCTQNLNIELLVQFAWRKTELCQLDHDMVLAARKTIKSRAGQRAEAPGFPTLNRAFLGNPDTVLLSIAFVDSSGQAVDGTVYLDYLTWEGGAIEPLNV